jgi:hypothetical protein
VIGVIVCDGQVRAKNLQSLITANHLHEKPGRPFSKKGSDGVLDPGIAKGLATKTRKREYKQEHGVFPYITDPAGRLRKKEKFTAASLALMDAALQEIGLRAFVCIIDDDRHDASNVDFLSNNPDLQPYLKELCERGVFIRRVPLNMPQTSLPQQEPITIDCFKMEQLTRIYKALNPASQRRKAPKPNWWPEDVIYGCTTSLKAFGLQRVVTVLLAGTDVAGVKVLLASHSLKEEDKVLLGRLCGVPYSASVTIVGGNTPLALDRLTLQ